MREYLISTFKFNDWANRQVLEKIKEMPDKEEAVRLFSHLITSQNKWMARINNDPNQSKMQWFETPYDLAELEAKWTQSINTWMKFLESSREDELNKEVRYTAVNGIDYGSTIKDMALQLNYHSIHHRAQICLLMRKQDVAPPFIEYIGRVTKQLSK
jgi:uncharacterized damage-inducible protein DinB